MVPRVRIRTLVWSSALVLILVTSASVAALLGVITVLQRSVDVVSRDTRSAAIADDLEVAVLMYNRLGNVFLVTRAPDLETARADLRDRLHRLLVQLPEFGGDEAETRLIERLAVDLPDYLEARVVLDTSGTQLEQVVRDSATPLNRVLGTLDELKAVNDLQVHAATERAHRANRVAMYLAGGTLLLLAVGALVLSWGAQRMILRPVRDLHTTVAAFRGGERLARSPASGGALEVAELTRMFNDMAESLEQQRQAQLEFLGGVAHDLKNPLSTLKNGMYLLAEEASEAQRARTRRMLDGQLQLLVRMVDDFLDSARIEAGELELRCIEFDLRHLARDLVNSYGSMVPTRHLLLHSTTQPLVINADSMRIEQVIRNLLSNALKYSNEGDIDVRLYADVESVVVEVEDRGRGIPESELEAIFLPFRRRALDEIPGVGLGLSVVRRLVRAHGGAIEVDSRVGEGSTFRIRLPWA